MTDRELLHQINVNCCPGAKPDSPLHPDQLAIIERYRNESTSLGAVQYRAEVAEAETIRLRLALNSNEKEFQEIVREESLDRHWRAAIKQGPEGCDGPSLHFHLGSYCLPEMPFGESLLDQF